MRIECQGCIWKIPDMIQKGKFVVIEGVDGSGKTTQFNLLLERLKKKYKKILVADFPRYYDSVWGKMVGEFLNGKYGKFESVDPLLTVLPYMIDQYTWGRDIGKKWIDKGGTVVSNRYFTSNVHQIAKLKGRARKMYRDWLWPTGYKELGIIKPDLVIFLDVPPKISLKLIKEKRGRAYLKGKKKDAAERNRKHQLEAYKEYLFTIRNNSFWTKARCTTKSKIDLPEIIHERVWKKVSKIL